ncbi:MAG TPA: hypothetical protein VHB50_23665 [Bryobacteraceae bacterium]|nr:hypothetical protein [Bryobacteraceae bacterium]
MLNARVDRGGKVFFVLRGIIEAPPYRTAEFRIESAPGRLPPRQALHQ